MTRRLPTIGVVMVLLAGCGPGKSTTTAEETGVADGSWTGPVVTSEGSTGGSTGATSGTGSGTASSGTSTSGTGTCEDGCASVGATAAPEHDLPPPGMACDPWAQDCPEGQKCTYYAEDGGPMWDKTACAPIPDGAGEHGEACTVDLRAGNDTCDKGHVCWDVDPDTMQGTCRAVCTGALEDPQCPPAMHCILARTWTFCELDCHPLMQDCADAEVCVPAPDDPLHFYCLPDGSGADGQALDACGAPNGCDPGLMCADPGMVSPKCDQGAGGCCTQFCDLTNPSCADKGQSCAPYFEAGLAPPGFESLGACAA